MATLSFVLMVGIFKAVIKLLFIGFRGYALPVQLILCWVTFTTPEYFVQKLHLVRHLGRGRNQFGLPHQDGLNGVTRPRRAARH